MPPPLWLQELRDVLAATDYEARRAALQHWEHRWLVELHWTYLVTEAELHTAPPEMLTRIGRRGQHAIGEALAKEMVVLTCEDSALKWAAGDIEIRVDAWALRREPKTDA